VANLGRHRLGRFQRPPADRTRLDQVHARDLDMLLLHGGSPNGAVLIASSWTDHRKVAQAASRPDCGKHDPSAPFKRNDALLDVLPIGILAFSGTSIQENLADKARKLAFPVI